MYNTILFITVIFIFSLIYLTKFKREDFQSKCEFSEKYPGGVYNMLKPAYKSDAACRAGCRKDTNCKSYSWNNSLLKCSHLPRSLESVRERTDWIHSQEWLSYNKICESNTTSAPEQPKFCKFNSPREGRIDKSRASKTYNNKNDKECRNLCLTNAICKSYSYHTNEKHCYLYPFYLSYSDRAAVWENMKGGFWRTYDKICQDSPFTTTTTPPTTNTTTTEYPVDDDNTIYFYNTTTEHEENKDNDKLMKFYTFDNPKSKIIIKLKSVLPEFFISFYVKFGDNRTTSTPKTGSKREIFIKQISNDNKTYWSIFKFNNSLYYSVNKEYYKFYTPLDTNKDQYYFVAFIKKDNKLTFKINNEPQTKIIEKNIENSIIVFGGSDKNLINEPTNFNGKISTIRYGYYTPDLQDIGMPRCKFYPSGDSLDTCTTNCIESNSRSCSNTICDKLCRGCQDKISCKWVHAPTHPHNPIPNAPEPIRTTAGNKRVIVEWKKPFEGTTGKIVSYIITVKESYPKDKSSNDEMIYNFEANECENCQYEIKDLKNTIYYDISVKSQNRVIENKTIINNISKTCSNIETVAPIGPINVKDYHPSLVESDEEIQMIYNNNPSGGDITCDQKKYKFDSQNTLDSIDINKYSENGIMNEINDTELLNTNTNKPDHNINSDNTSDDILQYLGDL